MVKKTMLTFAVIFITAGCTLNDSSNNNENFALRIPPSASNAVQSITTLKVGLFSETASSSDETIEQCQEFKLTEEQVKKFFSTAITVMREDYVHSYLPSRCYVEGTLQSMSNKNGLWYIDRARRGQIMYDNQESTYFFCNDCEEEVFYEACDLDCALAVSD